MWVNYKTENFTCSIILNFYKLYVYTSFHNGGFISFFTAITLKVTLGVRFLTVEAVVDSKYNGTVTGLMGNFDGDSNNDFVLPNGTILQAEDVNSERKIYNNFGQMCNVFFVL